MENNEIKKAEGTKNGVKFRNKIIKIVRSVPFLCTLIGLIAGAIGFCAGLFFGKKSTEDIDMEYLGEDVSTFEYDEAGNIIGGPGVETEN